MAPDVKKTRLQHLAGSTAAQEKTAASNQQAVTEGDKDHNCPGTTAPNKEAELQSARLEIELNQRRFETLRRLTQMIHEPEQKILDFALEAGLQATDSRIGYIYFVNEDETELTLQAWSRNVMEQCRVDNPLESLKVAEIGLLGEAVRRRRPIITNDYPANPQRRELPEGHIAVRRHMSLPLFDDGRIVAMAGVGNKPDTYTEQDVQQLSLIMEGMWNIIKRKRAEAALHRANVELEEKIDQRTRLLRQANRELQNYKGIVSSTPDLIALVDGDYVFRVVNDSYLQAFSRQPQEIIDRPVAELFGEEDFERYIRPHLVEAFNGETVRYERWITFPTGGRRLCAITFHPVPDPEGHICHVAANIRDITEGKLAVDDRQRIFEASFDMLCFIGVDGCFKDLNPSWTRTLGWSVAELLNTPWLDLVHPKDQQIAVEAEERLLLRQQTGACEYRLRCKNGRYKWVVWNASADLERQEIFATLRDITDSKLMQEALKSSVRKYRTFFDSAGDAVFVHDFSERLLDVNRVACERLGYSREELLRMPMDQFKKTHTAISAPQLLDKIEKDGHVSFEAHHRAKDGRDLLVWTNARRTEYDGLPAILSICRDISERKRIENELRNLAITDSLTGAWNRRYFISRGKEELARSLRYGTQFCLLILDIDFFKLINDTYGHDIGDEVLKSLTERCRIVLRETDVFARLGGEEFAALLPQTSRNDALLTADRLRTSIAAMPMEQISENFSITVSIGVSLSNGPDSTIEELMKQADQAMYRAKKEGRNRVVLY